MVLAMVETLRVSAPGKLMLMGEHAVLNDRPCLVTAVDQRMTAQVEPLDERIFELNAPAVGVDGYEKSLNDIGTDPIVDGARFVEQALSNFLDDHRIANGLRITTRSDFSASFGFGSSSASAVCTIKALSTMTEAGLSDREIFDRSYQAVLDVQGKGSGFDVAAAVYGGTLYYRTGGADIEPLNVTDMPLMVGYTGIKQSTTELIEAVEKQAENYPQVTETIYDAITMLVDRGSQALVDEDWITFGELMDFNQGYLESLGVGSMKLTDMIYAAREAGAYGAKLSGAGVGDCMIALAKNDQVGPAIDREGELVDVDTGADGVRVET